MLPLLRLTFHHKPCFFTRALVRRFCLAPVLRRQYWNLIHHYDHHTVIISHDHGKPYCILWHWPILWRHLLLHQSRTSVINTQVWVSIAVTHTKSYTHQWVLYSAGRRKFPHSDNLFPAWIFSGWNFHTKILWAHALPTVRGFWDKESKKDGPVFLKNIKTAKAWKHNVEVISTIIVSSSPKYQF